MISRYTRPEMAAVWDQKSKYEKWLLIEKLCCEALAEVGAIPLDAAKRIVKRARFNPERIDEIERVVKHDVVAFLTSVAEFIKEDSRYLHLGLTSSDILDTALALQLREAADIILRDLENLASVLKRRAFEFKDTPMIGRTHGVQAEPITFGLKLAIWYDETRRNIARVERAREIVSYGKVSGAVGSFANVPPSVEKYVCSHLGLRPAPASSQIVQRDRHAEFMAAMAITASSFEKFAVEVRHLQRTEVLEVEEYFAPGQKGSSAMPHKRNPIASEQICGLARLVRANAMASLENMALWHERDISHSSVERIILPDTTILLDYMATKMAQIIDKLVVYPKTMMRNLDLTRGVIFSESVLLELARRGLSREEAYEIVQRNAMKAFSDEMSFKELLAQDEEVSKYLSRDELDLCFDIKSHLKHVDAIFGRVFG